jgi:hypothetical protein
MKLHYHLILLCFACASTFHPVFACQKHNNSPHASVESIAKHEVQISSELKKQLHLTQPGIGSGLVYKGRDNAGHLLFYSITDRGVNFDNTNLENGTKAAMFMYPDFKPFVSEIRLKPGISAEVIAVQNFNFSGLPPHDNAANIPISTKLDFLPFDPNGLDSEAIDYDAQGNFWIADEYRPAIFQFAPDGRKLKQIDIGDFLPDLRHYKMQNRGIESLVITPNNKLLFAIESILDIENKTKNTAEFIRVVEYDINSGAFQVYAYPFDYNKYKSRANVKIGDIAAINKDTFLFVEQGMAQDGEFVNDIYVVRTKGATNIADLRHSDGKHLEFKPINDVVTFPLKKHKLISMRDHHWNHEKLEGIAYIDDKTIALINDNDFGLEPEIMGVKGAMIEHYQLHSQDKTIAKDQKKEKFDIKFHNDPSRKTEMWLVKFKEPILNVGMIE